ncbi:MAG: type II toxin-antitoxin system VapC family toxin [Deltaproteobacteria bacterium]|jgi:tRNA(fMet)-specific endonuclease VapC|nr:type II toxin-antitoxin system VapC family toxin [Deltaproteobacteria bacterium]MBT4644386.1 type II toxin-antitoxin system VapC family toxin [Deltaproteobacteria bacterium]
MFVLDTNILIYYFKGIGRVAEKMLAQPPGEIGIPAIVLYELQVGIAKASAPKKRKSQLNSLIEIVRILPFGAAEATSAAFIRADLEKKGKPLGPYDTLIAATALAGNSTLVSHNTKEFKRVSKLKLVDWF